MAAQRAAHVLVGIALAQRERFGQRHAVGDVAVQRVVRAGLVGEDVGDDAAAHQFRQHVGAVADQADRERFAVRWLVAACARASSSVRAMRSQ